MRLLHCSAVSSRRWRYRCGVRCCGVRLHCPAALALEPVFGSGRYSFTLPSEICPRRVRVPSLYYLCAELTLEARSRVELAACKDTSTSSNRFSLRYSSSPLSCGRGHASDVWLKAFNIARSRSWASLSSGRYLFAPCVCVTRSAGIRRQISIVPHQRELEDQSLSLREARPCTSG